MERTPSAPNRARFALARRFEFSAWIVLWLGVRVLLLLAFCDVFGYGEEMEKACAGKALLDGLPLLHHQFAYHAYEGGGFVVSHLDALAFALFGESVLALKLVALAFGSAILFVGWRLAERFGGRVAARAFAALYTFAPESVQTNSLLALGIHYQAILFVALILLLALRIATTRDQRPGSWFVLGLLAGFGFYFSYQLALTLVVAAAALGWSLRRACVRGLPAFAAGALVGAAPLLWMAAHVGGEVFDVHGAPLVASLGSKGRVLEQFWISIFAGRAWWASLSIVLLALTPLGAAVALSRSESRGARCAAWVVLAHALLFLVAYLGSGFTIAKVHHYFYLHRLTPLWFLATLLVAWGAACSSPRGRVVLRSAIVAMVAFGALDTVRLVRDAAPHDFGRHAAELASTKGYRYSQYLQKIAPRLGLARPQALAALLRFREERPELLHEALAIALYGSGEGSFDAVCAEMRAAGVAELRGFYLGMGLMLMRQHGRDFATCIKVVEPFPPEIRDPMIESIGRFGQWELATADTVLHEAQFGVEAGFPEPFFRGLGHRLYAAVGDARVAHYFERRSGPMFLDERVAHALIREAPESCRAALLAGYDAACVLHTLD